MNDGYDIKSNFKKSLDNEEKSRHVVHNEQKTIYERPQPRKKPLIDWDNGNFKNYEDSRFTGDDRVFGEDVDQNVIVHGAIGRSFDNIEKLNRDNSAKHQDTINRLRDIERQNEVVDDSFQPDNFNGMEGVNSLQELGMIVEANKERNFPDTFDNVVASRAVYTASGRQYPGRNVLQLENSREVQTKPQDNVDREIVALPDVIPIESSDKSLHGELLEDNLDENIPGVNEKPNLKPTSISILDTANQSVQLSNLPINTVVDIPEVSQVVEHVDSKSNDAKITPIINSTSATVKIKNEQIPNRDETKTDYLLNKTEAIVDFSKVNKILNSKQVAHNVEEDPIKLETATDLTENEIKPKLNENVGNSMALSTSHNVLSSQYAEKSNTLNSDFRSAKQINVEHVTIENIEAYSNADKNPEDQLKSEENSIKKYVKPTFDYEKAAESVFTNLNETEDTVLLVDEKYIQDNVDEQIDVTEQVHNVRNHGENNYIKHHDNVDLHNVKKVTRDDVTLKKDKGLPLEHGPNVEKDMIHKTDRIKLVDEGVNSDT